MPRERHRPGDIDSRRQAEAQPFLVEQLADHGEPLGIRDAELRIDRRAVEVGGDAVLADPFGNTLGMVAFGLFFAAGLWRRGLVTLADLFRPRWGVGVERLAALIMIPSSVMWAAAQIRAFGQILASVSEVGLLVAEAARTLKAAGAVPFASAVGAPN